MRKLTMQEYGSPFAGKQGVRNIGGTICVSIANSVNARDVGDKARRSISLESSTDEFNASLLAHVRALFITEAGQERSTLNRLALCEFNAKKIELRDGGTAWVGVMCVAALDALDFADGSVVDCDVAKLEILFPLGKV